MSRLVILDTGPLVASLDQRDHHNAWVTERWKEIEPPFLTCESVLSEACFLLRDLKGCPESVIDMVVRGIIVPSFRLEDAAKEVRALMAKYQDLQMSLADACLVRMAERISGSRVFTLDREFTIYRKGNRQVIPVISPPGG